MCTVVPFKRENYKILMKTYKCTVVLMLFRKILLLHLNFEIIQLYLQYLPICISTMHVSLREIVLAIAEGSRTMKKDCCGLVLYPNSNISLQMLSFICRLWV